MIYDKNEILKRTSMGLDIFKFYLGDRFKKLGKPFRSPFYDDKKASCFVYQDKKTGIYKFKDFGLLLSTVDCFGFMGYMFNLNSAIAGDFIEILKKINQDILLNYGTTEDLKHKIKVNTGCEVRRASELPSSKIKEGKESIIKIIPKEWNKYELNFWAKYGVGEPILTKYSVISIKSITGISNDGRGYEIESNSQYYIFGYKGQAYTKVYKPFDAKSRFLWVGTKPENYVFGWLQLPLRGHYVFLTGGEKDVLSLAAKGFPAISLNSETANLPKNLLRSLSHRFRHIILLYDVDKTGLDAMNRLIQQYKEFDLKSLHLPLSGSKDDKDVSDYFYKGFSSKDLQSLFTQLLSDKYRDDLALITSCEIDFANPPKKTPQIVSINNVTIGSPGNIMAISGSEGSGKSNYLGGLLSGAIRTENTEIDTLGTTIKENTRRFPVLLFDTEQSDYQLFKNVQRILQRADLKSPPEWFKAFSLVGISRNERLSLISKCVDHSYSQHQGIYMVVIDGIADLLDGVNEEESSVQLIEQLFQMASTFNTLVISVLHMTPSGMKLRGHLGSELQRKAAGILVVEKDLKNQNSLVKALKVRDGSPFDVPVVHFGWSESEGRHIYLGSKNHLDSEKQKLIEARELASRIFQDNMVLTKKEVIALIMKLNQIKERMGRIHFDSLVDQGIIEESSQFPNSYRLVKQDKKSSTED